MKNESTATTERPTLVRRIDGATLYNYRGFSVWIRKETRNTYPGGFQKRHKVTTHLAFGVPGIEIDGVGGIEKAAAKIDRALAYLAATA